MNLAKLFETQKLLDNRIVDEHNLHGQDLIPQKILSLQVELGELAQNWRGFKFWSRDQEPRTEVVCRACNGEGGFYLGEEFEGECMYCEATGVQENPLLEEYVDCLHFILSIGLELKEIGMKSVETFNYWAFKPIFGIVNEFSSLMSEFNDIADDKEKYVRLFCTFIGLGVMLGFTPEQIEQSYYAKNAINHTRQDNKY